MSLDHDVAGVLSNLQGIADDFAANRESRQPRRHLERDDFSRIHAAGFTRIGTPADRGGLWQDVSTSTRTACRFLRTLAHGDSSVALVSAMHPAVLSYWLTSLPVTTSEDFAQQCTTIFDSVDAGHWWGTITSEPGSGGDVSKTRATAAVTSGPWGYALTGQKHFGSGSGVMSYMVTTALPSDADDPDWFFVNMHGVPWDGSAGVKLIAEWDGHGMVATQSHALSFQDFPATRFAWPGNLKAIASRTGGFIGCLFASVIVGIVDIALETAQQQLPDERRNEFQRVELTRAKMEHWLIEQALEGMIRETEQHEDSRHVVLQGKTVIAELAESVMNRLVQAIGGSTFSRRSPFGYWYQDVRALGFLRPPWPLVYDQLISHESPQK